MIWKNIKYNGIDFSNNQFKTTWIILQDCDWRNSKSNTKISVFESKHWANIWFTKYWAKIIKIKWKIANASKIERWEFRKLLDYSFSLEWNFSDDNYKKLEITDDNWDEYEVDAKVYNPIQFLNELSNPIIEWEVDLICKTPYLSSKTLFSKSWNIWVFWWIKLPTKLPSNWWGYWFVEINNESNFSTPCKISAFGKLKNPNIINLDTKKFFKTNKEIINWEIIIDSYLKKTFVNKKEIKFSERVDGSYYIFLEKWINRILLTTENKDDIWNIVVSYNKIII